MSQILLAVHALIAIALVGSILLQRNEGGGLGMGSTGGMAPIRGRANFLTRTTAVLAVTFMGMSLFLAIIASHGSDTASIMDGALDSALESAAPADAEQPSAGDEPAVPLD